MPAGEATGPPRAYQEQCRDLLVQRIGDLGSLEPFERDGIDVALRLGPATHRFDVVLRTPDGRLTIAECKRWADSVSQGELAEFAHWANELRRETGGEIAAFFFATKDPQLGLLQTAVQPGIRVVVYTPDQPPETVVFSFVRYDPDTDARVKNAFAHMSARVAFSATVSAVVNKASDTGSTPAA